MSTEYVGKMLDGQMHGHGKLTYENDESYDGDFVRGDWRTFPTELTQPLIFNDLSSYSFIKLSGKRHGQGLYIYADGSTFKGDRYKLKE